MGSNQKTAKISGVDASNNKLLHDLQQIVADCKAHLYTAASLPGEDETIAKTRIQKQLQTVGERLFPTDSPVLVNTHHLVRYVHRNHWRSVCVSACAILIVAMQNVKH